MIKITNKAQISGMELSKFPEHLDSLELSLVYGAVVEVFVDITKVSKKYLSHLCSLFKDSKSVLIIKTKDRYSVPWYVRRLALYDGEKVEKEENPLSRLMNGVLNYVDICDFCYSENISDLLSMASELGYGRLANAAPKDLQKVALLVELVEAYCKIQGELK